MDNYVKQSITELLSLDKQRPLPIIKRTRHNQKVRDYQQRFLEIYDRSLTSNYTSTRLQKASLNQSLSLDSSKKHDSRDRRVDRPKLKNFILMLSQNAIRKISSIEDEFRILETNEL